MKVKCRATKTTGASLNRFAMTRMWMLLVCMGWFVSPDGRCCAQVVAIQQPDILALYLFNGADEATFRRQLENRAQVRVARIAEVVELDTVQLEKLKLATQGDLSRFYRELEHVRQKTKGLNSQNPQDMQKAWEVISPVQQRLANGVIDQDSMTERILQSLLNEEQQTKYTEFQRQRHAAQFNAILRMTISDLEKSVPLTEKQRDRLIKIAQGQKLPANAFDQQQLQAYVGYFSLATISDQELGDLLDEQQLRTLRKLTEPIANMFGGFRR